MTLGYFSTTLLSCRLAYIHTSTSRFYKYPSRVALADMPASCQPLTAFDSIPFIGIPSAFSMLYTALYLASSDTQKMEKTPQPTKAHIHLQACSSSKP